MRRPIDCFGCYWFRYEGTTPYCTWYKYNREDFKLGKLKKIELIKKCPMR